jgi:hypothetical protein
MSEPGDRLRALAARVCSSRAMERVLDPAIADMRWEHQDAWRHGRALRAAWIRALGSLTVLYLIARHLCLNPAAAFRSPTPDRAPMFVVLAGSAAVVAVTTAALITIILSNTPLPIAHVPWLVLYMLPGTLPCTVPCGFALAVSWSGRRPWRAAPGIAIVAATLSVLTLITVGWIMPRANQAYRVTVVGHDLARGFNELTFAEAKSQLAIERYSLSSGRAEHTSALWMDVRDGEYSYHGRLAISVAPLVVGLFAFLASRRGRVVRVLAMIMLFGLYFAWYGWMESPVHTFPTVSPAVLGWTPNIAVFSIAALSWATAPKPKRALHRQA